MWQFENGLTRKPAFIFKLPHSQLFKFFQPAFLLALVPVGTYAYWTLAYPVNVPFLDDFLDSVLTSLVKLKTAPSTADWWRALTAYYNEHRLVYTRLVALLSCALNDGRVDFRFLILVGNTALLALLGVFWRSFRRLALPAVYFLPVPFLVLQTQAFENMLYGMASLQNFTVPLFAALALAALTRSARLGWALTAAVLASLTSGNGLFVFLAGVPVLYVQRRWGAGVVWLLAGLVVWVWYLYGYQSVRTFPTTLLEKSNTFFGLLGGAAGAGRGAWIPILFGLLLFGGLLVLALPVLLGRRRASGTELFYLSLFAWVVLTAGAIALNRGGGANTSLSRYKVYPMLVLVVGYVLTLHRLAPPRRVWFFRTGLLLAIPFWALTQLRMPALLTAHRQNLLTDVFNWRVSGTTVNPKYVAERFRPYPRLVRARAAGVYEYPQAFYSSVENQLLRPLSEASRVLPLAVDSTSQPGVWTVRLTNFPVPTGSPDEGVYLLLQSDSVTYLFPSLPDRSAYRFWSATGPNFTATLAPRVLRRGRYRLGLYVYRNGTHAIVPTTTQLVI